MTLTVLDLFSGIGGISLGLERAGGFRTVAFCEIEPFCRAVLGKHWPEVPIHEDVTKLRGGDVGPVDMICGGFPCQDVSVAGKGAGLDGKRSGLWSEYARLVGELGPRWVLAENVGALRTRGVDRVCSDLEGEGYAVWPLLVGAWAVGAPHKRERVWIVARRMDDSAGAGRETVQRSTSKPGTRPAERGGAPDHAARRILAHRDRSGSGEQRGCGLLDGERAASRDDADGRGERPVGEPTGSGLEGQRPDAVEPQEPEPRDAGAHGHELSEALAGRVIQRLLEADGGVRDGARDHARDAVKGSAAVAQPECERRAQQGDGRYAGPRFRRHGPTWPARPGEPQHEWEEPRLAHFAGTGQLRAQELEDGAEGQRGGRRSDSTESGDVCGERGQEQAEGRPQLPLGGAAHGLPERLVRRANREALKALGNSVVPQVVTAIGYAILAAEGGTRE